MKITDRYTFKTVTTNYNTICKFKPYTKESKKNLKYHICIKNTETEYHFYNVVPMYILTHDLMSYMMKNPIISIEKSKFNKNKLLKMFSDKPAFKKELEAQFEDNTMTHIMFSIKNFVKIDMNENDNLKINEDLCIPVEDKINVVYCDNKNNFRDYGMYGSLYEENECSYGQYVSHDLLVPTRKRRVKKTEEVKPVVAKMEEAKPEVVIDKTSNRYRTLVQLFGNNEELIKKMYWETIYKMVSLCYNYIGK